MATWQDVDRVRREYPLFNSQQIADCLGCCGGYVRETFKRKGWRLPARRPNANVAAWIAAYEAGEQPVTIGAKFRTSSSNILTAVRRWAPESLRDHRRGRPARAA